MATTHYTTFWEFIRTQKIEIPIIQRDYAQGRNGQEKLREKFLKDLESALDKPEQNLKLDFVYGSLDDEKLQPLDGQQRLTTLWLLHWFIAYKAGKLSENSELFRRFSYETRTSSREFCSKLSEFNIKQPIEKDNEVGIVEHIQNQTWFYSAWKQDPTIQAMLNMLGGTDVKEKDVDIIDGIEELFKDNYELYWSILTSEKCPIIFYYMPITELKLSDDLYIKMNARGKPLTSFENFKADLTGYLKKKKEENANPDTCKFLDINDFEHKIDADWTDVFWKNRSVGFKIDEIYFAFLNRYFLNAFIASKKPDGAYFLTQQQIEEHKVFKYLTGNNSEVYSSFDVYETLSNDEDVFTRISKILNQFSREFKSIGKEEINSLYYPNWDNNSKFRFIPEYAKNENNLEIITTLTLSQRVVFHSICCYFEKNKYEEVSFKRWMRVVWNIVENANIVGNSQMIGTIRLMEELSEHSSNIYEFLSNSETEIKSNIAKEQVEEEREKAKKIIEDPKWEYKIIEAEKAAFFKGAIRFLFRTDVDNYNWNVFDARLVKTKSYFELNGVRDEYSKEAILLRFFFSKFSQWEHFYPWDEHNIQLFYDNHYQNWKNILTHKAYISPVNSFFDDEIKDFNFNSFNSLIADKIGLFQNDLVKTSLLSKIEPNCTFHWWNRGYYSLYPYNTKSQLKIYVLADKRNEILSQLEKDAIIKVKESNRIEGLRFYRCWEIYFTLMSNGIEYQWCNGLKERINTGWKDHPNVNIDNLETYLKEIKV